MSARVVVGARSATLVQIMPKVDALMWRGNESRNEVAARHNGPGIL
ncbi:MAG: hypothetical protein KKH22_01760 [Proteobacteria bacterium]|nr:hypothetical protein [Pseudomonadota bacterium]